MEIKDLIKLENIKEDIGKVINLTYVDDGDEVDPNLVESVHTQLQEIHMNLHNHIKKIDDRYVNKNKK